MSELHRRLFLSKCLEMAKGSSDTITSVLLTGVVVQIISQNYTTDKMSFVVDDGTGIAVVEGRCIATSVGDLVDLHILLDSYTNQLLHFTAKSIIVLTNPNYETFRMLETMRSSRVITELSRLQSSFASSEERLATFTTRQHADTIDVPPVSESGKYLVAVMLFCHLNTLLIWVDVHGYIASVSDGASMQEISSRFRCSNVIVNAICEELQLCGSIYTSNSKYFPL
jgi:hypothetical protein